MKFLWRWLKRLLVLLIALVGLLLLPVGYTEIACRAEVSSDDYQPIVTDPKWRRTESRTLTTYPEWHIVHAYDDYAQVIGSGDPHDFGFLRAVTGFWTSLCPLAHEAGGMGGFAGDSKLTIYTIGVSFTAELLAKAAYEETVGRIATWVRGDKRSELDEVSARQAREYARFLQQTPWYKWDFPSDVAELRAASAGTFRDRERAFALGLEFGAKSAYAEVIADAVQEIGVDALRMRSVIEGIPADQLERFPGVVVIEELGEGILVETDRYRTFTGLLQDWAKGGANMVEIAGNDEILFTIISDDAEFDGALYSFPRQGYDDWRHLILVPVTDLLERIRDLKGARLEHVHDY